MAYIVINDQHMHLRQEDWRATHADGTSEQCDNCGSDSAHFVPGESVTHWRAFRCPECDTVYNVRE